MIAVIGAPEVSAPGVRGPKLLPELKHLSVFADRCQTMTPTSKTNVLAPVQQVLGGVQNLLQKLLGRR